MKKKKSSSWLRPRGYIHLTKKFNPNDIKHNQFLKGYISNWQTVSKHSFLPLIHRPLITRRYKKTDLDNTGNLQRAHSYVDPKTGTKKSNAKTRHIYYATHLDAYIYSYYCKVILEPLYLKKINSLKGLSDCISAYRKIPITKSSDRNKSNIHFANDAFKFVRDYGACSALTFDITSFFDSLDQKLLKQKLCGLFGTTNLRGDVYNIFKSLTRLSYVEYYALLKELGIKNQNKLRSGRYLSFLNDSVDFESHILAKGLLKRHPFSTTSEDGKNVLCGIPQGTPISAFLSNLYMIEFDILMHEEIINKRGGLYRRYSDDIIIVCRPEDKVEIEKLVLTSIKSMCNLNINKDKVDVSNFIISGSKLSCNRPLRYLGFEFDGQRITIKDASLSKFHRQMKKAVKAQAGRAKHNKSKSGIGSSTARIYKRDLYKRYSHLSVKGKERSYHVYAREAAEIMKEPAIKKQLSKSWNLLNQEIVKYEEKYEL